MAAPRTALPCINDSWPNGLAATVFLRELMDGAQDGGRQTSVESLLIKQGAVGGESERPPPTGHERERGGGGGIGGHIWKGKRDEGISLEDIIIARQVIVCLGFPYRFCGVTLKQKWN